MSGQKLRPADDTSACTSRIIEEVAYYGAVAADPGTPDCSRWLLAASLAYLFSPIGLIPDFVPIVGTIDDLIVVAGSVLPARLFIPTSVLNAHRDADEANAITISGDDRS